MCSLFGVIDASKVEASCECDSEILGDGKCDHKCNTKECRFDLSDCETSADFNLPNEI